MATQTQLNPQTIVAQHFRDIQTLLPHLSEPGKGAISYATLISENPTFDQPFCQQAGKVVRIAATLSEKSDHPVTIRGSMGPLSWGTDRHADQQTTSNFYERTFTFHVPPEQMNGTIDFKFCVPPTNVTDNMHWSSGHNFSIDLRKYGHIAMVDVKNVSFN